MPPDGAFPVESLTLSTDGRFTATGWRNGSPVTRTGTYRWNGSTLRLETAEGGPVEFGGRRRSDGSLLLVDRSSDSAPRAVFEPRE